MRRQISTRPSRRTWLPAAYAELHGGGPLLDRPVLLISAAGIVGLVAACTQDRAGNVTLNAWGGHHSTVPL